MSNLLKSREFWLLVVTLIVTILVALVPQLAASKDVIINSVMALVIVIIGAMGLEKAAAANTSGLTKIERTDAANADIITSVDTSPTVKSL